MNQHYQRRSEINTLFQAHQQTIDGTQAALRREIPSLAQELGLTRHQTAAIHDYIDDRITIFRFLFKNDFSLPPTVSMMLDTVKWRIRKNVDALHLAMFERDFLSMPFCFFNGNDRIGRPVLMIQLSELPDPGNAVLGDYLSPFVCFVFEVVRRYMRDLSETRIAAGVSEPVLLEGIVLLDFKNLKSLPKDPATLRLFISVLKRFPLSAGSVCLLNFSWMYTGVWQMVKMLLTEEAKRRVSFPKVKDLRELIDDEAFISALEKPSVYAWKLSQDNVFKKYGSLSLLSSLPISRTDSNSSISTMYFDTLDAPLNDTHASHPSLPMSTEHSVYATPSGGLTPFSDKNLPQSRPPPTNRWSLSQWHTALQAVLSYFVATKPSPSQGIPADLLNERLLALRRQQRPPARGGRWISVVLVDLLLRIKYIVVRLVRKAVKHRSIFYWIVACAVLQRAVQDFLQNLLSLTAEFVPDATKINSFHSLLAAF